MEEMSIHLLSSENICGESSKRCLANSVLYLNSTFLIWLKSWDAFMRNMTMKNDVHCENVKWGKYFSYIIIIHISWELMIKVEDSPQLQINNSSIYHIKTGCCQMKYRKLGTSKKKTYICKFVKSLWWNKQMTSIHL